MSEEYRFHDDLEGDLIRVGMAVDVFKVQTRWQKLKSWLYERFYGPKPQLYVVAIDRKRKVAILDTEPPKIRPEN